MVKPQHGDRHKLPAPCSNPNMSDFKLTRRRFLQLLGAAILVPPLQPPPTGPNDWSQETDLARSIREYLESAFNGREMALDFRRVNANNNQEFRIQIQSDKLYPVASCFKAWIALYYYLYTPRDQWADTQGTPLYSTIVYSNNTEAGTTLAEVAERVPGTGNPIQKFNDFLRRRVGMLNGMYAWNWPGSATTGFTDERFLPSDNRGMVYNGEFYRVDNLFSATDLAHGYDVLQRGQSFARWDTLHEALLAADALLSIRAPDYTSPLEYAFPEGYMGKDGILPETDLPAGLGRVINDAGVVTIGDAHYIIGFMSMGESESIVRSVLADLAKMVEVYERGRPSITPPPYDDG